MFQSTVNWIERHPKTGWYIATVTTLNFLLLLYDKF